MMEQEEEMGKKIKVEHLKGENKMGTKIRVEEEVLVDHLTREEVEHLTEKKTRVVKEVELECLTGENEGTATITLNRGRARNALNKQMVFKLQRIVGDLAKDAAGLKAVVIRSGAKGIFCAGADLKERMEMKEDEVMEFLQDLKAVVTSLEELPVPVLV